MISYKKLYHKLFNDITDVIRIIESTNDILSRTHFDALDKLKQSQIEAEEMYLDMCEKAYPNGEDLEGYDKTSRKNPKPQLRLIKK